MQSKIGPIPYSLWSYGAWANEWNLTARAAKTWIVEIMNSLVAKTLKCSTGGHLVDRF